MNQVSHFQHFTRSEGSGWDFISPIGLTWIPIRIFVFSDYQHVNGTRSYLFTVSPHLIPIHSDQKGEGYVDGKTRPQETRPNLGF